MSPAFKDTRSMRDQEDRANIAVGAMVCLQSLVSGQANNTAIDAEPLANLLDVVFGAVCDALPNGWPKHGRAVNDEED